MANSKMGSTDAGKEFSVDDIRSDLKFQLATSGEIDWDYFVETALRGQAEANRIGANMNWENK